MADIPDVEFVLPRGNRCVIRVAREVGAADNSLYPVAEARGRVVGILTLEG